MSRPQSMEPSSSLPLSMEPPTSAHRSGSKGAAPPVKAARALGWVLSGRFRVDGRPVDGPGVQHLTVWDLHDESPRCLWLLGPGPHPAGAAAAFLAQGRGLLEVQHPGLVQVVDLVEDGRHQGWVVEAPELRPLGALPLSMDAVVRVAMEGLEVLSYLHARGLVHGGLRLDTAGLDHQGRLRLPPPVMDGFAADGGPGRESSVCPPEVLRDPRLWTAAADIFAWGAVIYELVTGVAPLDLARAWDAERWPREIPAHLRDALIAALAPRPQDRPMDAACLRGAFARQAASTGP